MATTPRGDDAALRREVVTGLARRIVAQRTGAGTNTRPVPLRPRKRLTATPMPLPQGARS
jgi:hypothetical protein